MLGAPQSGLALRATAGAFSPAPTTMTYTWLRCDATGASCASTGATGADYAPQLADVGKTLRVEVAPVNGTTPGAAVRSEPSPAVLLQGTGPSLLTPVPSSTPSIAGTATVGQTLTAAPGVWVQLLGGIGYRWLRCDATGAGCAAIGGATSQSYTLTAADRGARLSLAVTVSVLGLVSTTAVTETTAVVG